MAEHISGEDQQRVPEGELTALTAATEALPLAETPTSAPTVTADTQRTPTSEEDEGVSEVDGLPEPVFSKENCYVREDVLLRHVARQTTIVKDSLSDKWSLTPTIKELSDAYEKQLFCPSVPPKRQENGTCEPNPRVNFYPTFIVPETLATYHIFFQNQRIPLSCRANRTNTDHTMQLKSGDTLPCFPTLQLVNKIFEGLGNEETVASNALREEESALVELEGDSPRLAVVKRTVSLTHFAYPAVTLPPKVMATVTGDLIVRKQRPLAAKQDEEEEEEDRPVVTDEELARWLNVSLKDNPAAQEILEERRKTMMAVCLVTLQLECMHRFFTHRDVLRKLEESLHYAFRHGYIKQASIISNVELSNIVSYLGILHENRLGQSTLHTTLKDESRRDYIRDTVYLFLIHTWQTAMGVWQQCLEPENLKELSKLLHRAKKSLWAGFDELTIAQDLADIVFPEKLLSTLQNGLPDLTSQSILHNFRSFILERSGILPAMCNALPSDFVPISYRECPPTLWAYTYLFKLANYLMFHSDIAYDVTGEGLLQCYCRCNLCTPHRCLATNNPLLSETQVIGTFEIQGPPGENQKPPLKLSAGLWTSAFLRKFVPEDYHAHKIQFYEDQSKKPNVAPSACVITQEHILAQLHDIKKAREEFLLKKGHGVYLDPHTGEELNGPTPSAAHNEGKGTGDPAAPAAAAEKAGGPGPAAGARRPGRGNGHQRAQRRRGGGGVRAGFGGARARPVPADEIIKLHQQRAGGGRDSRASPEGAKKE